MKLEIFFDYLCEFCEIGHQYWNDLLPKYPQIIPIWRPCEAHPRLEEPHYGMHSDIAIQGMFFIKEHDGNTSLYHDYLFSAVYKKHENIEDPVVLSHYAELSGVNSTEFLKALQNQSYLQRQIESNQYAYINSKVIAVPTFILESGQRLDSKLGIGVTKEHLNHFLHEC